MKYLRFSHINSVVTSHLFHFCRNTKTSPTSTMATFIISASMKCVVIRREMNSRILGNKMKIASESKETKSLCSLLNAAYNTTGCIFFSICKENNKKNEFKVNEIGVLFSHLLLLFHLVAIIWSTHYIVYFHNST